MRLLLVVPAVLVAACAAIVGAAHARHAGAVAAPVTQMRAVERDFRIALPKRASSGDLLLTVVNHGPDDHELIVVRATGSRLPLRSDGLTVDEEALDSVTEGALEPGAPGSTRELRLHLRPGRYEFFCNMSGHFMAGMRTELVVRQR